jgi:hypothetical protein
MKGWRLMGSQARFAPFYVTLFQDETRSGNNKPVAKSQRVPGSSWGSVAFRLRRIASTILGMLYYQNPALAALVTSFLFPVAYKNKFLTRWQ